MFLYKVQDILVNLVPISFVQDFVPFARIKRYGNIFHIRFFKMLV